MTEREMAAVLLAYANGAAIQYKSHYRSTAEWETMRNAVWQFSDYDYRVAPRPREFFVCRGRAYEMVPGQLPPTDGIHVREVMEGEA